MHYFNDLFHLYSVSLQYNLLIVTFCCFLDQTSGEYFIDSIYALTKQQSEVSSHVSNEVVNIIDHIL